MFVFSFEVVQSTPGLQGCGAHAFFPCLFDPPSRYSVFSSHPHIRHPGKSELQCGPLWLNVHASVSVSRLTQCLDAAGVSWDLNGCRRWLLQMHYQSAWGTLLHRVTTIYYIKMGVYFQDPSVRVGCGILGQAHMRMTYEESQKPPSSLGGIAWSVMCISVTWGSDPLSLDAGASFL